MFSRLKSVPLSFAAFAGLYSLLAVTHAHPQTGIRGPTPDRSYDGYSIVRININENNNDGNNVIKMQVPLDGSLAHQTLLEDLAGLPGGISQATIESTYHITCFFWHPTDTLRPFSTEEPLTETVTGFSLHCYDSSSNRSTDTNFVLLLENTSEEMRLARVPLATALRGRPTEDTLPVPLEAREQILSVSLIDAPKQKRNQIVLDPNCVVVVQSYEQRTLDFQMVNEDFRVKFDRPQQLQALYCYGGRNVENSDI